MGKRHFFVLAAGAALVAGGPTAFAASSASSASSTGTAQASKPGPHVFKAYAKPQAKRSLIEPPAPPCPAALNSALAGVESITNCHVNIPVAAGNPVPGNMAYYGGPVQTNPHIYLVLWGWGQKGAFGPKPCHTTTLAEPGVAPAVLHCDPDGAGKRMADFVSQLGGTSWAGIQTQYYEIVGGKKVYVTNPKNQLAGIWTDDTDHIPAKPSYTDLAREAQRAAAHFHVSAASLTNDNFVIAQPAQFSDPKSLTKGYCAFHDYTQPKLENGIFNGIRPGLPFTNMPYLLNLGTTCGQNLVNDGAAGLLDGVTIALGHEIEEVVTDPGSQDVLPNGRQVGGWFDVVDSNENGDKCAYVFPDPTSGHSLPLPGVPTNITGNRGGQFAVQSLWSNAAAGGLGYCDGSGQSLGF